MVSIRQALLNEFLLKRQKVNDTSPLDLIELNRLDTIIQKLQQEIDDKQPRFK